MGVKDKKEIVRLLKKWQGGDQQAYEIIYEYYYKYVYYVAFQFFHNHEKAEDAVQEAFLEAYHKIGTLKELNVFQAWIKRIVYRKCLNQVTYEKKDALSYSQTITGDSEVGKKFYHEAISINQIQLEDATKLVIRKLSELDEKKRMIGYLRFLEGYKAREIAEIMAINTDTVNTNIRRIKQMLKEELEENNYRPTKTLSLLVLPNLENIYGRLQGETLIPNSKLDIKSKASWGSTMIFSVTMILFSTVMIMNKDQISEVVTNLKDTKIVAINYPTKVTNQPISIDVSTNNKNYDDIYIDDKKTTNISDNGIHTITIKKNNNILDQKQIVITNIDNNAPYIFEKKEEQNFITLYIKDDHGINYQKIELYRNNQKVNDITIDKTNSCITLPKIRDVNYLLKVPDINGNNGEFTINSYEKEL